MLKKIHFILFLSVISTAGISQNKFEHLDFSDVDPQLLKDSDEISNQSVPILVNSAPNSSDKEDRLNNQDESKAKPESRSSRFFNRSKNDSE